MACFKGGGTFPYYRILTNRIKLGNYARFNRQGSHFPGIEFGLWDSMVCFKGGGYFSIP